VNTGLVVFGGLYDVYVCTRSGEALSLLGVGSLRYDHGK